MPLKINRGIALWAVREIGGWWALPTLHIDQQPTTNTSATLSAGNQQQITNNQQQITNNK